MGTNGTLAAGLALAALAAACRAPGRGDRSAALPAWAAVLPADVVVVPRPDDVGGPLPAGQGVVLVDADWRLPDGALPPGLRLSLAQFVRDGGRLVLFGHAARHAATLGFEPQHPEPAVLRWGFDARAHAGTMRLGLEVVSDRLPELAGELAEGPAGEALLLLAGGSPCTAPLCTWAEGVPEAGAVLARAWVERDGVVDRPGAPALVHWTVGRGQVLAAGVLPVPDHADATVRAAAAGFVQRCVAWARGPAGVQVWCEPSRALAAPAAALLPLSPLVPHWGWELSRQRGGDDVRSDQVLAAALLPSWLAGADLCQIELAGADGAVPVRWAEGDPLQPAPGYRAATGHRWDAAALRGLAAEAHSRGMLAFGALEGRATGGRAAERLATLRFLARELSCVRRHGTGALDGFGLGPWLPDAGGLSVAMLQDFQPAARLLLPGERQPAVAGALRALDAADGALGALPFAGIAGGWRDGFPADVFPLGGLDARARADRRQHPHGGGSEPDWIVAQANDFARERAGRGAAMWWRRHEADTLAPDTAAYVHGVAAEPLRAAVAMPLAATGSDGVRAAAAAIVDEPPAGFGATVAAPAAVHVLQNNRFRLLGSGGRLDWDERGTARFPGVVLSPALLRTRLLGARPDAAAAAVARCDLLACGQRGEGGYGEVAAAHGPARADRQPPAVLAADRPGAWPAAVAFAWDAPVGYHELDLALRGVHGRGIVAVRLDGVLLQAVPFRTDGAATAVQVPVHVARAGGRELRLELLHGGACALDRAVLQQVGDVGVEAQVAAPAGCRAVLVERSASARHAERVELCTVADFPGLVLHIVCERASRGLMIERVLALPRHELADHTAGGTVPGVADARRQPFVLRGRDRALPDVVVVPLQLARHEQLAWRAGELHWQLAAEPGLQSRLGLLFCPAGEGRRWLPVAAAMLRASALPGVLDLGAAGSAVVPAELPLPWTRVVHVPGAATTPFLVREQGYWQWRGSQPAAEGGRWLRLWQQPGDVVEVVGGPAVLARTRPGPGSLHLVALRDPEPGGALVRVLQPSALVPPSVVLARDFDEVQLDGAPWAWFDGRTVVLPNRAGDYRLSTRRRGGEVAPHVRATGASLVECRYLPETRELLLVAADQPGRPAELPWTAVLGGPAPTGIDAGEIVADATLRLPAAEQQALQRAGGTLIRFRSGTTRVRYGR